MFLFGQLPYAMSGAGAYLNQNPQTQQLLQQIQNPYSSTGTTVPQNYWNGMQFNMPPIQQPQAPKPVSVSPAVPAAPITTPGGFKPTPTWSNTEFGAGDDSE